MWGTRRMDQTEFGIPWGNREGIKENTGMAYSDKVLDHYTNPRNVGTMDKASADEYH